MASPTAVATADYPTQMYIDGQWTSAQEGKTLGVINPADESVLAQVAYGGRAETEKAIAAADISLDQRVSVTADDATIDKVFEDLLKDTGLTFRRTQRTVEVYPTP